MSELGEISAELNTALARLARVAQRFAELDRTQLASLQDALSRTADGRAAASLVAQARTLMRQAEAGAHAARAAGDGWLAEHGSPLQGGAGAGGIRTPSGSAYFEAGETQVRANAVAVPPFGTEYTLSAHGDPASVVIGGQHLGAAGLAELIRSDPEWGGRPVRLLACSTGQGENPLAAQLADELGVAVTAPDTFAWTSPNGEVVVAPERFVEFNGEVLRLPDRDNPGSWRRFDPRHGKGSGS